MPSKFEWDADEVIYVPPVEEPTVQDEIDRIDRILEEAGDDSASFADAALEDASTIATLYVQRKVLNASEILAWAKKAGIQNLVEQEELHVTLCCSSTPVDWMEIGQPFEEEVRIPSGGPRVLQVLGVDSVALIFASSTLKWRHKDMVSSGARHDWQDYIPHITIAKGLAPTDLLGVPPYTGEILLGPEIFEEVKA